METMFGLRTNLIVWRYLREFPPIFPKIDVTAKPNKWQLAPLVAIYYTEAKVDVTQEIEQRAQWSAPAWAACCALCSISCVTSTLASVYAVSKKQRGTWPSTSGARRETKEASYVTVFRPNWFTNNALCSTTTAGDFQSTRLVRLIEVAASQQDKPIASVSVYFCVLYQTSWPSSKQASSTHYC